MTKSQLNLRVSDLTRRQLEELTARWGTSITETITVLIDRASQKERTMHATLIAKLLTDAGFSTEIRNSAVIVSLNRRVELGEVEAVMYEHEIDELVTYSRLGDTVVVTEL